ncbi:disease resistance protein [Pyrus ussuriensis x Pyrus communis]|uniref:Disease resistance protein n=1 Tax=Pyrus ussuriensis x Pyrus communis TaxID=2448454 RepID=A0A5N5GHK3_9ROSA|nr:disease resistance protein [Pyrus ussuriensis x Pyrus communis]
MLEHCAGLPLAITVLAGLVARKVTVEEWKTVYENVDVYIRRGTNLDQEYKGDQERAGASWVLALSYDDLPYRLKLCFLYLGHFSEDYEIPVKRLAQLWIAEVEVLEDVAYACLIELVERCMVQVGTFGSTKKIKTCHLHDLMRDLCLRQFLKFEDLVYIWRKYVLIDLRSVVCNFKLLRVLKFEGIMTDVELPSNIGNLVHLRFLSLRGSDVRRLPSSLGNLVCLQTLDLSLHLYLPFGYRGKLKLATLGNLQSLVNVAGADCDLTHLAELTNLRKLLIRAGVKNMEEMLKSSGITFNHLRSLSLEVDDDDEVIPMNMVLSCPHIYKLELSGRIREQSLEGL